MKSRWSTKLAIVASIGLALLLPGGAFGQPAAPEPAAPAESKETAPSQGPDDPFPDAAAVVESWTTRWEVGAKTGTKAKVTKRILVRDPRAFHLADQSIDYWASRAEITHFEAKTIQPDGSIDPVAEALTLDKLLVGTGDQQLHRRQFTFPRVRPGSILEYSFELSTSRLPIQLPVAGGRGWEYQGLYPVRSAVLEVTLDDRSYGWKTKSIPVGDLARYCREEPIQEQNSRGFRVSCRDVPGVEPEPKSPPIYELRRSVLAFAAPFDPSTIQLLGAFSDLTQWLELSKKTSQQVDSVVAGWPLEQLTADEKVTRVMRWVREQIGLQDGMSVGDLEQVLRERQGTAIERNLLALALLRAAGVRASPALLVDRTQATFGPLLPIPSSALDLVVVIETENQPTFIDVNCDYCFPGVVAWQYAGTGAGGWVFDPLWTVHPVPPPAKANSERRQRSVRLAPDGSAQVEGSTVWQVQRDVERRTAWGEYDVDRRQQDCLSNEYPDLTVDRIELGDPEVLDRNLACKFAYHAPRVAHRLGETLLLPAIDDFSAAIDLPLATVRRHPLRWRYPFAIASEINFLLPEGYRVGTTPEPKVLNSPGMSFRGEWKVDQAANTVTFRAQYLLEVDQLPPIAYFNLLPFVAELRQYLRGGVTLESHP